MSLSGEMTSEVLLYQVSGNWTNIGLQTCLHVMEICPICSSKIGYSKVVA